MIVNVYIKIKIIAKLRIKIYIKNGMNNENIIAYTFSQKQENSLKVVLKRTEKSSFLHEKRKST